MSIRHPDLVVLSRLLDQALDLGQAEQEAWLTTLPEEERHLVPVLRDMLAARDAGDGKGGLLTSLPALLPAPDSVLAVPGERVGPYRLVREIGRGGMGEVWLAERADGSFQRNVALKLPHVAWGAGLVARMARERQIGALLEHPNIARLYDAGVDSHGRPYLALEFIDGQAIDGWCRERGLTVAQKLALVAQVARAVAYAHGRLVVHRDIKPSNVLVSPDGQPHLLDFGIAKLLADAVSSETGLTQEMGRVLTPNYASPEQIRGEAITVASDVYSLGVLAYELMTRRLPYSPERRTLAALEQLMAQGPAPAASVVVQEPTAARALRGEVDAILAKAIHLDPARRYASADAFADDIAHFLRNEPVQARPDSRWYRLSKAVRRHRIGVTAGTTVLATVLAGGAVALVQSHQAEKAAQRERVVKEFVIDVFRVNAQGPSANPELRALPAEMLLQHGANLIEKRFPGRPELQAELYGVVAGIFADMDAYRLAIDYARRHIEALAQASASPAAQARGHLVLLESLLWASQYVEAEAAALRAVQLAGRDDELAAHAMTLLARAQRGIGRPADALQIVQQADKRLARLGHRESVARASVDWLQAQLVDGDFDHLLSRKLAALHMMLRVEGFTSRKAWAMQVRIADELIDLRRTAEALQIIEPTLAAMERVGGLLAIEAAVQRAEYAARLHNAGQVEGAAALAAVRQARAVVDSQGMVRPSTRAELDFVEACIFTSLGRIAQAQALMAGSLPTLRAADDEPAYELNVVWNAGLLHMMAGNHDEADTLIAESLRARRELGRERHPLTAYNHAGIALNRLMQGKIAEARTLLDRAPTFGSVSGMRDGYVSAELLQWERARLLLHEGDAQGALQFMHGLTPPREDDHSLQSPGALLGEALCSAGESEQGLQRLLGLIQARAARVDPHDPVLARHRAVAGLCALGAGQREKAERFALEAHEAFKAETAVSPYFHRPLAELDRRLHR